MRQASDPNRPTRQMDPIVAEVRGVRDAQAARLGYDVAAIIDNARARQRSSYRAYVRYPPRRVAGQSEQRVGREQAMGPDGQLRNIQGTP